MSGAEGIKRDSEHGISSGSPIHANLAAEGAAGAGPDPGPAGGGRAATRCAFTNKRIAPTVEKVLRSAIDNAKYLSTEKGLDVDVDNLYVKQRGERRPAHEAHPPGADGPRVPLRAAHCASS